VPVSLYGIGAGCFQEPVIKRIGDGGTRRVTGQRCAVIWMLLAGSADCWPARAAGRKV